MARYVVYLDFINRLDECTYEIEGYIGGKDQVDMSEMCLQVGNKKYALNPANRVWGQELDAVRFDRPILNSTFTVAIKLSSNRENICFMYCDNTLPVKPNRFSGLSRLIYSHRQYGEYRFTLLASRLSYAPAYTGSRFGREILVWVSIMVNLRVGDAWRRVVFNLEERRLSVAELAKALLLIAESVIKIPESLLLRIFHYLNLSRHSRPLWLVSDRPMAAGDNGEAFYRFEAEQDSGRDVMFVLSRKSADYGRLIKIGKVVEPSSFRHKLYMLRAEAVISSQADVEVINPYKRQLDRVADLFTYKYIFLQHGVIRHDLSAWLNRFNRNIALFITSSHTERQLIINENYYYPEEKILLSGLPRFDYLDSRPKNKLILAPTYRNYLLINNTDKYGQRRYDASFKQSEYYMFYNKLINDPRLLAAMKNAGMVGELYLHPVFEKQRQDFKGNDVFYVMNFPYNYTQAINEGSVMVSDYSSVVFDFAYLKKPILYAHFDESKFFDSHSYSKSASISDKNDGFGDVCLDYDSLVNEAIKLIESGCAMSDKYQRRVDNYFYRIDRNNSRRVYEAVVDTVNRDYNKSI